MTTAVGPAAHERYDWTAPRSIPDPYDPRANSETFDLTGWLATINPEMLDDPEGRKALTIDDPLLFAVLYLRKHLESPETGGITLADCHLDWVRLAREWTIPDTGLRGWRHSFASPRNSGKALALDTPILTVDRGWITHGELKVGDRVFDERGKPCNVVGVSEKWQHRPCYELNFSDGSAIVADQAHEWVFSDRWSTHGPQVVDTATVAERWLLPTRRDIREARYSTPIAGALEYSPKTLPIAPYALGAWLGDGDSLAARITVGADDLEAMREAIAATGESFKVQVGSGTTSMFAMGKRRPDACLRGHIYGDKRGDGRDHCRTCIADRQRASRTGWPMDPVVNLSFHHRLTALGVLGDKHIPESYLTASIEQRMQLLRGLMDTDGTIGINGRCEFSVCNERLALDTAALVRSLGIKVNMAAGNAVLNGRIVGTRWRVSFSTGKPIFSLPRKIARLRESAKRSNTLSVVGAQRVADQATSCIEVDSPSRLYLAGTSLVPTHNSTMWYTLIPIWAAAHGHIKFIATFANGSSQSEMHLQTFRTEAAHNALLRQDFLDMCTAIRKPTGRTVADNEGMYQSRNGFVWVARGIDVASLGMKVGDRRPDAIVLDDIEKDESRYSPGEVEKRRGTLIDAIMPLNERAKLVLVGTVTRPGSINHQLVKVATKEVDPDSEEGRDLVWIRDERITPHYYPPIVDRPDGSRRSMWPEKWSLEYLESIENTRNYQKNFKNNPRADSGDYWSDDDIRYGTLPNVTKTYLFVDPPLTQKTRSDPCGLAVLGYAPGTGVRAPQMRGTGSGMLDALSLEESESERPTRLSRVIVKDAFEVKLTGTPLKRKILDILQMYPEICAVVLENNAGGDLWLEVMTGLPVKFMTFPSTEPKEVRLARALDFYQKRRVIHAKRLPKLEDQQTAFPRVEHDDVVDAASTGTVRLLAPKAAPKRNSTVTPR
jgi:hypothetical protein